MAFSYEPLRKLLHARNLSKKDFMLLTGLSISTVSKLQKDESVSLEVLDRICGSLKCDFGNIIKHI